MNKRANVKSGEIYAIPLVLENELDNKSFAKYRLDEYSNEFVFCRVIEDLGAEGF